jgi:hypothetical protein
MTRETKLQRLERLEHTGPINPPKLSEADRKWTANIARRYHTKRFQPYDYSGSSAKADAE